MKRSRKWVLAVPAAGLLSGWLLWPRFTYCDAPAAPIANTAAAATTAAPAPADKRVDAAKLRDVQALVDEKNREARKDRDAFIKDGWKMVDVPPPDHAVVNFDTRLLDQGREHDLKMQLLSTVPSPESVRRVAEIARRAKDEATRYAAVEAMGHLKAPEATDALYDLLTQGGLDANDAARQQIAPLLQPTALDDPMAAKIAALLDSPSLSDIEKQQIAFTLALIGLRDGMTVDAPISAEARALIDQMTALAKSRFVKALDRKGGNP